MFEASDASVRVSAGGNAGRVWTGRLIILGAFLQASVNLVPRRVYSNSVKVWFILYERLPDF